MTNHKRPNRNWYIAGALLGLLSLAGGLYLGGGFYKTPPELQSATLYPDSYPALRAFSLQDQHGRPFTQAELQNHWSLLFFGYTSCPDICPNTLYVMQQIREQLQTASTPVQMVFVSIDPGRDAPARLAPYLAYFNAELIGLTGDYPQLDRLVQSLGVYYSKPKDSGQAAYLVDHSAGLFLINPDGRPQALFSAPHQAEQIARDTLSIVNFFS